jgi:hypothetical protein
LRTPPSPARTIATGAVGSSDVGDDSLTQSDLGSSSVGSEEIAWQDDEPNSIIYSAPDEREENAVWLARGMVDAGSYTLYTCANCLVA